MLRVERLAESKILIAREDKISQKLVSREVRLSLLIAVAHIPLGLVIYNAGAAAIIHPLAVFLLGMYWAVKKRFGLERVALAAGYIIGAEVLWRMAHAPIYWEFGKYAPAAIMITALVARRRLQFPKLPLIYFVALIPACFLTLADFDLIEAGNEISFNMSGPFLLLVASWFFSNVKLTDLQLQRLLYSLIIPMMSVACVTLFFSVAKENIQFSTESNLATSGGFGPNQVSSILGLAAFLTLTCIVLFSGDLKSKAVLTIVAVFFVAQCVLTFSRGGIYNAVGGLAVMVLFNSNRLSDGIRSMLPVVAVGSLFFWFVFPLLNNFTGGMLQERFEDSNTTGRTEIIQSDFEVFKENPIFGVGVGASPTYREPLLGHKALSHTELTRLVSEHGVFGVIALVCLFVMAVFNVKKQRLRSRRALVAGIFMWSGLFMLNAGMRLGAPSFMLGLTFILVYRVENGRDPSRARSMFKNKRVRPRKTIGTSVFGET